MNPLLLLITALGIFVILLVAMAANKDKPSNPQGFGNGDDETDYEESDPDRK